MAVHPQPLPYERQPQETPEAFRAFKCYLNLGSRRTLDEAYRQFCAEQQGSGLKFAGAEEAPKKRRSGKFSDWSRQHRWVDRAADWDRLIDARVREKQIDAIEKMAVRHTQQAELLLQDLMAPAIALAQALRDPERLADLHAAKLPELLKLTLLAATQVPKVQKAERLSRGVRVTDLDPVSSPTSAQGGATWTVQIHQPPRSEPLPDLSQLSNEKADEWE